MRLSLHSDYALRLLLFLQGVDRLATVDEISTAYDVSKAHLQKVAKTLSNGGFVETVRGRQGGVRLARSPEAIGVGEVIRYTEASFDLIECFHHETSTCALTGACALEVVLGKALEAFLQHLDRYSLADLALSPRTLQQRLGISV